MGGGESASVVVVVCAPSAVVVVVMIVVVVTVAGASALVDIGSLSVVWPWRQGRRERRESPWQQG